ncbi:chromosome segregation ATPase [Streptococcus rupicaprae]|uniref:Chromosome segregation ATPase n=1 Tax=Streptococcus rupicaprae TaxID=759619 RepID=A0ABV2FJR7_9STRE
MNKRIKKKWSRVARLETKVAESIARIELAFHALKSHKSKIEDLEKIQEQHALATNNRFDKLEKALEQVKAENKKLRKELKTKRSWFGRK